MLTKWFPDFVRFAKLMDESMDTDPTYPVIRYMIPATQREAFCFHYAVWYDLRSAWINMATCELGEHPATKLPAATERRGMRTESFAARVYGSASVQFGALHSAAISDWFGVGETGPRDKECKGGWVGQVDLPTRYKNYSNLESRLLGLFGFGRWATYKLCELLKECCGYPISAPHMAIEGSSGPLAGLKLIVEGWKDLPLVARQDELMRGLSEAFVRPDRSPLRNVSPGGWVLQNLENGWVKIYDSPSYEAAETWLCNFKSLVGGRYYVGHDIDEMQHRYLGHDHRDADAFESLLRSARSGSLPKQYLGEWKGWHGVDRDRCKVYANTGEIVTR